MIQARKNIRSPKITRNEVWTALGILSFVNKFYIEKNIVSRREHPGVISDNLEYIAISVNVSKIEENPIRSKVTT